MNNTKILFSTFDDYTSISTRGGTAIAVHEVAKRLCQHGHQVVVITSKRAGGSEMVINGVVYKRIGVGFGSQKFRQIIYLLLLPYYAFVMQRSYNIWFEAFTGPISTAFLPWFTKRPVVGITHFFNAREISDKYHLPFDKLERFGVSLYKYLCVLTASQEKQARLCNESAKIFTIPNGIEPDLLQISREPQNYLFYMGRLEVHMKSLDVILRSFAEIVRNDQTIKLKLAGRGGDSDEKYLHALVCELKIEKNVEFVGYVSEKEKRRLLSEAKVFVHPSRFETFGISILEAMAAGLPVVVFDIPGLAWIPNTCIAKVPFGDEIALRNRILSLLTSPSEAFALGQQARMFAQTYSWDAVEKSYGEMITQILEEKPLRLGDVRS